MECTRDALADLIAADVASVAAKSPSTSRSTVLDPFAGSGNTLYWLARRIGPRGAVGYETDDGVFEATRRNFSIVRIDAALLHVPYEYGLRRTTTTADELLIVFVAPPWGDALHASRELDLEQTKPPVAEIIDAIADTFPQNKLVIAGSALRDGRPRLAPRRCLPLGLVPAEDVRHRPARAKPRAAARNAGRAP